MLGGGKKMRVGNRNAVKTPYTLYLKEMEEKATKTKKLTSKTKKSGTDEVGGSLDAYQADYVDRRELWREEVRVAREREK